MWFNRREVKEVNANLSRAKDQIERKDAKIKELMTSVQALNRDLNYWEPLANVIAAIDTPHEPHKITIPEKGAYLLKLQHLK